MENNLQEVCDGLCEEGLAFHNAHACIGNGIVG